MVVISQEPLLWGLLPLPQASLHPPTSQHLMVNICNNRGPSDPSSSIVAIYIDWLVLLLYQLLNFLNITSWKWKAETSLQTCSSHFDLKLILCFCIPLDSSGRRNSISWFDMSDWQLWALIERPRKLSPRRAERGWCVGSGLIPKENLTPSYGYYKEKKSGWW